MYAHVVYCMQSTSIRIQTTTRDRLHRLKKHPRESFDAVITRLLDTTIDDEPLSEETLATIERSLKEYREGIYYTHEEILAELGVAEDPDTSEIVDISDTSQTDRKSLKDNASRKYAKTETDV
ncbi:hypothetical protein L0665_06160 [Methanogenium marinum]|uniref:Uncharacterized protein n=1 Tax=Methanogenium marinum TaxID=348610 RepID=A0A9Q4KSX8_9EURY|nr:hypothetical protein [Methanogenium marinum]MDE4908192.1 hypothetical protein [Methanogenium marinum]